MKKEYRNKIKIDNYNELKSQGKCKGCKEDAIIGKSLYEECILKQRNKQRIYYKENKAKQ